MMMFSRILRNCKSFDTSGWWPTMPIIIMKQKNDDSTLPLFSTHPPRPVNDKDLLNFNFSWFLTFGQADQSKVFPIVIIKMVKVIIAHGPGTGTMVLVQWYLRTVKMIMDLVLEDVVREEFLSPPSRLGKPLFWAERGLFWCWACRKRCISSSSSSSLLLLPSSTSTPSAYFGSSALSLDKWTWWVLKRQF